MFEALKRLFLDESEDGLTTSCVGTKNDLSSGHVIEPSYYVSSPGVTGTAVKVHDRDCSGCRNDAVLCNFQVTTTNGSGDQRFDMTGSVKLEHLAMEFTNDAELSSFRVLKGCPSHPCTSSTSSQQFILKEYLAGRTPDLVIIFGNSHDNARFTLSEHAMNVRYLADILDIYLAPATRLVWTSKPAQYDGKKPLLWRNVTYEKSTKTIIQWLDSANAIQYGAMRDRFIKNDRPLMFLDLLTMALPVLEEWNTDGVHMKPEWYRHVASYLMQTICNS